MSRAASFLKKIAKFFMWAIISIILLLVAVALLIRVPAVQSRLVSYATSFVSKKTHTKVEIGNFHLSFPLAVVIEGVYLEDLKKDTLLYAGEIRASLAFRELLNHKVHIKSLTVSDVNLHVDRTETDTLFNYNFLLTAFSDSTKVKAPDTDTSASKWAISVDDVILKNIMLRYEDLYGGTSLRTNLGSLRIKMDKIDPDNNVFDVNDLQIKNLSAGVLITKESKTTKTKSKGKLPTITAKRILISNSTFAFGDSVNRQSVAASLTDLKIKNLKCDLESQLIELSDFAFNKSKIGYVKTQIKDTTPQLISEKHDSWKVNVKNIVMKEDALSYNVDNVPEIKKAFDPSHLNYSALALDANDFSYSPEKTAASVEKFSVRDANGFTINQFSTGFAMDEHSIHADKLILRTNNSTINASVLLNYRSLSALKDSIRNLTVNADLKNVKVKTADILYFSPQLISQPFFQNTQNITTVSGIITGPVGNLTGRNVLITTGSGTSVKTNFIIAGLPYADLAYFNFPNLSVKTGRKDILMMAGTKIIPNSIELPENISLLIDFKGQIKSFTSTIGLSSEYGAAHVFAMIDKNENFQSKGEITGFDLGKLLKDPAMFGPVTMNFNTTGHGLNKKTIKANVQASAPSIYLNQYVYHDLKIDGNVTGQKFEGDIHLNDPNAIFDFKGLVDLNPDMQEYKFTFDLKGADLQKLHLYKDDMRIGMYAISDLKGASAKDINGKAGITKIVVSHNNKTYVLDSLLFASINEKGKSEMNMSSAIVGIKYTGTFSPVEVSKEIKKLVNNYFPIPLDTASDKTSGPANFNFEIQMHNHPILSEVFFPQLKEFDPGLITGSFDSEKKELKLDASMRTIIYNDIQVKNLLLSVNSDASALNYKLNCTDISNAQVRLENFTVEGKAADKKITTVVSSVDQDQKIKLRIGTELTKTDEIYTLKLAPDNFYIANNKWTVSDDNYISFGKEGFLIHDLQLSKAGSRIKAISVHDKFNDDLNVSIENFRLEDVSGIIEKDTNLASGIVHGNILLKRVNNSYGLIADAAIDNLTVKNVLVGNFQVKAENPTTEKFNLEAKLSGADNNISINGYFIPKDTTSALKMTADIQSLSLKTVEVLSMGQIKDGSGSVSGKFLIEGSTSAPDITGNLLFSNAFITPAVLNNKLQLKNEKIELRKDGVYFNSFTILDPDGHSAVIDGNVKMNHFKDFRFAMGINTTDFLLFNTTAKDNPVYYGRMIIDSKIKVNGTLDLPVINANLKLRKGSNFTFAVPEKKLTTDKGEGVVEFTDSLSLDKILTRGENKTTEKSGITGMDISSVIQVDREASLKLLIDPGSSDSLVVKGDAALSFALDPSGKMSLTGAYDLQDGSYLVSLESVLKRKFKIEAGSTITWNGDPLDADISINAIYSVRAAPIDLVADQVSGLSETDQNGYKQRYPFLVYLKLRGGILHPEISFEIQLPQDQKGILGGAVNAKLNMLNEDPSALNKQVFALLVLGRFIQENPLQTETNAASAVARTTVGKFLSAQLNQLSSKVVPGVELNFDVQSYDDYESGTAEGRTEVEVGIKKQLFNERLQVQVGGSVDVEGEKAKQNNASDITSDVTLEYKLTEDGRYKLEGFRHNQYEGAIEGQLVETGAGVVYTRDFERWKYFFRRPKKTKDEEKKLISNDSTTIK